MPKELFAEVAIVILAIPSDLISRVFAAWRERLEKYRDIRGNAIE
jgi:hypothetical protein